MNNYNFFSKQVREYNYPISQVFKPSFIISNHDIINSHLDSLIDRTGIFDSSLKAVTISQKFAEMYKYLKTYYRCEYVYKNELAIELFLNRHSDGSATYFKEFAVKESIADIVIVNGVSTAYEIKTDLDNFERLYSQVVNYKKVFDEVFVVCSDRGLGPLLRKLDLKCGILLFSENGDISEIRKSKIEVEDFDPLSASLLIRTKEFIRAYEEKEGKMPEMGNALYFNFCQSWYLSLSKQRARNLFYQILRAREISKLQISLAQEVVNSISSLILGQSWTKKQLSSLKEIHLCTTHISEEKNMN